MTVTQIRSRPVRIGRAITYAMLAYNIGVLLLLGVRTLVGEQWVVIAYLNHVFLWLLLLALPGAVICPLVFKWRGLPAVLPGLIFLVIYVPQFTAKEQSDSGFSVATYNASGGVETVEKVDMIRSLDADILGMEEIYSPSLARQRMESIYPYGFVQVQDETNEVRPEHLALFSRYPIDEQSVTYIGDHQDITRPIGMRLIVTVDEQPISVYVAHAVRPDVNPFNFHTELRHNGIRALTEAVMAETNPVVVLCDCNMSDWTEDYNLLSTAVTDSWRERGVGFGLTVPATQNRAPFPLMRGDYIWHTDELSTQSVELWGDSAGSEHFPLRAVLNFIP